LNKEGRTYFEVFEYGVAAFVKKMVSKVLPHAPVRTRIGLVLLGVLLLPISIVMIYILMGVITDDFFRAFLKTSIYQLVLYVCLVFGSIFLLSGKRVGWFIVTSLLMFKFLPRMDRLLGVFYRNNPYSSLAESLFGFDFPEVGILIGVLILLLVFMYSKNVMVLYGINKGQRFIPIIGALLISSIWTILNNFL